MSAPIKPGEAPPPYSGAGPTTLNQQPQHHETLEPLPLDDAGRVSMEDEARELPPGWIRQFDTISSHHFYVDTKSNPPRSIWVHPYDDDQWQKENGLHDYSKSTSQSKNQSIPSKQYEQQTAESSSQAKGSSSGSAQKKGFGERMKDKITGTTHDEREVRRKQRYQEQLQQEQEYMQRRQALMQQRAQSQAYYGQNPYAYSAPMSPYRRGGMGMGMGGMGMGGMGMGGMGMGLPLLGGLAGGALLGGALGGGFDGGDYGGGGGDFGGGGGDFGGGGGDGGGGF